MIDDVRGFFFILFWVFWYPFLKFRCVSRSTVTLSCLSGKVFYRLALRSLSQNLRSTFSLHWYFAAVCYAECFTMCHDDDMNVLPGLMR